MDRYAKSKIKEILTLLILIVLSIGCGNHEKSLKPMQEEIPVEVVIGEPSSRQANGFEEVSGVLEAADLARISTRMMGYIENIHFDVGDRVKKGQVLVNINTADLRAQLARVEANIDEANAAMENARLDYDRFSQLFESNSATKKELENVTTALKMAVSRVQAVEQAKKEVEVQFAYANIKSPLTGIVSRMMANAGDMATPGMPILEIESGQDLEVVARVPESMVAKIKLNDQVDVGIKAIDTIIRGRIIEIAPSAKYTGGQYLVKVSLENQISSLFSGMYATIRMMDEGTEPIPSFMIPESAIVKKGQLNGVFVVSESDKALLRWLRLGRTSDDMVEVLAGLSPDEKYILSASGKLYNGVPVVSQK